MFNSLVLNKTDDQKATGKVEEITVSDLPEGDVLINIDYSTINYKDALAITSSSPIIKNYPMVPGIDFSGTVEETSNNNFKIGDKVILNGFGVGEKYWGGLSQNARVNGDWLVKLPDHGERAAYITYRQALRDWPASSDFPATRPVLGT